jgi:hypothetical protein
MGRHGDVKGTRLGAPLGVLAAALALGASVLATGVRAETIDPHVVKPDVVTPHAAVAPSAEDSPRLPGSPVGSPAPGGASPTPPETPPAYIQCPDPDLPCGPLSPEEIKEAQERRAAREKLLREREEERRDEAEALRRKYLAEHPPTVIELYIGQFLCPLWERNYTIVLKHFVETKYAGLEPSDELLHDIDFWSEATMSRACITTVRP